MVSGVAYVWSLMGMLTILRGYLPPEFTNYVKHYFKRIMKKFWSPDPYCRFHFHEVDSRRRSTNHLYRQVELHLRAKQLIKDADDLFLSQDESAKTISYTLAGDETVSEKYQGVKVWWTFVTEKSKSGERVSEENKYVLKMLKGDKKLVMGEYMDYVARSATEYKAQLRDLHLYSANHERWKAHTFNHPATFETLAMDPGVKTRILEDLKAFREGQAYFKKVGRAWKRGYLLFGPPGTGKSSFIAAMANLLRYNVYDLELTEVHDNTQLKALLTHTTSKSIIVIEDIDCSLDLTGTRAAGKKQEKKRSTGNNNNTVPSRVTLSGLLNFTDGLWSCLGNERIIVFTTNHVEKLDAGLLRPGRMDMHIHMSFCTFPVFQVLARNYLSLDSHPAFENVQQLLKEENVRITPAEVTEALFQHKNDPELALQTLVEDLVRRTVEGDVKEEVEEDEMEPVPEPAAVEQEDQVMVDDDEKPCTRVHCNVASHANQVDWFKIYVEYKQKVQRQGGLAKRLPTRSRSTRY